MRKLFLFFVVLLVLVGSVSANYITGDIFIRENGDASFNAKSDVSNLDIGGLSFSYSGDIGGTTSELTSKEGSVWSFNLDLGYYDTILLDIHLPKNVESVVSLEGVDNYFDVKNKIVSLIGNEEELYFSVSYETGESVSYFWVYFILLLVFLVLVYFLYFFITKKKTKLKNAFPYINDNEKKILDLLMKGEMRQKQVREKLKIPKASFTRYVCNLEKKKLLDREGSGKNKVLKLR